MPTTKERPPGCRTIFVGGLPENATEEIMREVFERCGEIMSYRKGRKNFCHIRFTEEMHVDNSVYVSGRLCNAGKSATFLKLIFHKRKIPLCSKFPVDSTFSHAWVEKLTVSNGFFFVVIGHGRSNLVP